MANIIETWRKFIEIPEKVDFPSKTSDRRNVSTGKIINSQKKMVISKALDREGTSPAQYIQKLADKDEIDDAVEQGLKLKPERSETTSEKQAAMQDDSLTHETNLQQFQKHQQEQDKQLETITQLLKQLATQMEQLKDQEASIQPDDIKEVVAQVLEDAAIVQQTETLITDKVSALGAQITTYRSALKTVEDQNEELKTELKRLGSIKILAGISIWCSLLTFAVVVLRVLGFI